MKTAFLISAAFFTLQANAQSQIQPQTDLSIKPSWRAHCLKHDYPFINSVFDVQKLSENETTAVWQFTARHGFCKENAFHTREMDPLIEKKTHFYKSSFWGSSLKKVIHVSEKMNANDEIEVTLTIDKAGLFAKSNEVKADMIFHPMSIRRIYFDRLGRSYAYLSPLQFWWNVKAQLNRNAPVDQQTSVQVNLK